MPNAVTERLGQILDVIFEQPPAGEAAPADDQRTDAIQARIDSFRLPAGAADVPAYQDFTKLIFGAENVYATPVNNQVNPAAALVTAAYESAVTSLHAATVARGLPAAAIQALANAQAPTLFESVEQMVNVIANAPTIQTDADDAVGVSYLDEITDQIDLLIDVAGHNFDIFEPGSINIGVQLIYRQEWTPIRYQVGELLQTINLTPGEEICIETKKWSSVKATEVISELSARALEQSTAATKRDVRDVMQAASTKFGLKTEFNGSANLGIGQVGGSAGGTAEHGTESRRNRQAFREMTQRTCQTIRNERKVEVTTTTESGSESRVTRRIKNTNDEIPVTYLLYELARLYRLREWLHDVLGVVAYAMEVPPASAINEQWVIRNDWILAGAVLDPSFLDPIAFTVNEMPGLRDAHAYAKSVYFQAKQVVSAVQQSIRDAEAEREDADTLEAVVINVQLKSLGSRLKAATDSLHKAQESLRVASTKYRQGQRKVYRLLTHLRVNLLHYLQAIWLAEVPEQRYLRLRAVPYPRMRAVNNQIQIQDWVPLTDVADVDRPLAFLGNYVVFALSDENALVQSLRWYYLNEDTGAIQDPAGDDPGTYEVVTPADAIYMEALPGTHPLLEQFKLRHRAIDAARARQELLTIQLENVRRALLLAADEFGDPKVEKALIADRDLVNRLTAAVAN